MSSTENAIASSSSHLDSEKRKRKQYSPSRPQDESDRQTKHKRKHHTGEGEGSAHAHGEKEKHKHKHKHHHKDKGKEKEKERAKEQSSDKSEKPGPFEHRRSRLRLSVAPKYAGDYLVGVREMLDGMLMRYVSQMGGVLLAHWDHELIDDTVKIINECPYGICEVEFYSILWAPKIGQRLYGTHSLSSPSHISLLFSKTFNVSIPLQHIPTDKYEFEHTSPDDDEEGDSDSDMDGEEAYNFTSGFGGGVQEVGRWRRKDNGKLLGEGGKAVKFTVIGMDVTNQMLSLTGSLLSDPSNPPPPPETSAIPYRSPSVDSAMDVDPAPPPAKKPKKKAGTDTASKQPRGSQANGHAAASAYDAELQPDPAAAQTKDVIDERFLSARELKQRRKEEERKKRDARKARKEDKVLEEVVELGAEKMVDVSARAVAGQELEQEVAQGGKRKSGGEGQAGEKRKKDKS